jgi:polyisoprenoid-binding protein YceI
MSTTAIAIPAGTYETDGVHSTAGFAVKHMIVSTFRGRFDEYAATLTVGEDGALALQGTATVASLAVKDENLAAHLRSAEFFDTENHPTIQFHSTSVRVDGETLTVDGDLTVKGHTEPVTATGTISEPAEGFAGTTIAITLETIVDRTKFGLNWNAPLPKGGVAVANDVKLTTDLEFTKQA